MKQKKVNKNFRGVFIAFEGVDGAGKSTIIKALQEIENNSNLQTFEDNSKVTDKIKNLYKKIKKFQLEGFFFTREPGGTNNKFSEEVRSLILETKYDLQAYTEILLFAASRVEHLFKTIKPKLADNKLVFCDRFLLSSLVYQLIKSQGLTFANLSNIAMVNDLGIQGARPDLTFIFTLNSKEFQNRIFNKLTSKEKNSFDERQLIFGNLTNQIYKLFLTSEDTFEVLGNSKISKIVTYILEVIWNYLENKKVKKNLRRNKFVIENFNKFDNDSRFLKGIKKFDGLISKITENVEFEKKDLKSIQKILKKIY